MAKLKTKRIIIFKHGVSYFILEGKVKGREKFELEFKTDEMNDILKSLFVLDTSEKGYISSISYDMATNTEELLKSVMFDIPDEYSFTYFIMQIKGGKVAVSIGSSEKITGTVMGIDEKKILIGENILEEKILVLLTDDGLIRNIPFSEITSLEIENEEIKKDLDFFLETKINEKKKGLKKIVINCESGGDDSVERIIVVSYMHKTPVWKISYRLIIDDVLEKENKCLLAGFGLIENATNEDWEDVYISLVSGISTSFIYDIYPLIYIDRPVITPPKVLSAKPMEIEEEFEGEYEKEFNDFAMAAEIAPPSPAPRRMKGAAMAAPKPLSITSGMDVSQLDKKIMGSTKIESKSLGEFFEYEIDKPVSIKRKQSALVPILTEKIEAKKVLLYNKDEGNDNPYACLEIKNTSNLTFESGPITIIIRDCLAGEAILPFLIPDDTRLINYSLEQGVVINFESKSTTKRVHKISFSGSYIYEYYYNDIENVYTIKNKLEEEKELYIDHPKKEDYEIIEPHVEPEETKNFLRFKIKIKPKENKKFKFLERKELYSYNYIRDYSKEKLLNRIEYYISRKFIDEQLSNKLKEIAEIIGKERQMREDIEKLKNERKEMDREQKRIRENIKALGRTTQEVKLKEKYLKKLEQQEDRYERISEDIKNLELKLKEISKEIEKKFKEIEF
ncbi:MAG: hypothetical protein ACTSQP_10995 [Promethearchaeota archaeon]